MTSPDSPPTLATSPRGRFWRAALLRLGVYGGACLAAGLYLAAVRYGPVHPAAGQPAYREPAASEPTWPHLRGPHYSTLSDEKGLADAWPPEGPPVLWAREIGRGYSGMIAVGDRVYTQAQSLTDQKVLCLDAGTGATIWEHRYAWPYDPGGMYPGPRATPTWHGGRIYFAAPDGLIGCLDAADGRLRWSVNVTREFAGRGTDFGYSASPLVEEGKVILPVGGCSAAVVALDAESGKTVWAAGNGAASYSSAMPITLAGRRQVVVFLQNALAGFDLADGRPLWQEPFSHGYDEHSTMPLYDEPYLRTTQAFRGGSDLYKLEPAPPKNGEAFACRLREVRHDATMSNDVASSVLVGGHLYGFDLREIQTCRHRASRGQFRCMDFKTGAVRWSNDRVGHAGIVAADDKLLLLNDHGEVLLLRANPERCEELARAEVFRGEICWTAPALLGGRLYLRSPTRAVCLYVGKPERLDERQRRQATSTAAIPKGEWLELGWLIGAERECPFELPDVRELFCWYAWGLAAIVAAGIATAILRDTLRLAGLAAARRTAAIVLLPAVFLAGIAATPLGNLVSRQFVFTWPVALFAVHQMALAGIFHAKRPDRGKMAVWLSMAGAVLLVVACAAYYDLTRRLTLATGWYFLLAFLPAWPLAVPAARRLVGDGSLLRVVLWTLAAFSLFFWIAGAIVFWRASRIG